MKSKVVVATLFVSLFATSALGTPNTQILYETSNLGSGRWQYTYDVINLSLPVPIEEFTIWFDYALYDNLAIETPDPPAGDWDEIVWQVEPALEADGGYDALTLAVGIGVGEMESGFSVSFYWLGAGEPGSQYYEIKDFEDFHTIEDGYTSLTPEPTTLCLLGLGALFLLGRRAAKF